MSLLQCGFIANGVQDTPDCSKDISSSHLVPVSSSGEVKLVKSYSGGWGFGMASTEEGTLYVWGVNQATLLAKRGSADDGSNPSTLDLVCDKVSTAAAGFDHALVVKTGGEVYAFGPSFRDPSTPGFHLTRIKVPEIVTQVACGEHHSLILTAGGNIFGCGSNSEGQLGVATQSPPHHNEPLLVAGPGSSHIEDAFVVVAAGARHSVALTDQGQCAVWGWSLHGQCCEVRPAVESPKFVEQLGPLKCTGAAAGSHHTVVSTDQGDVYVWGSNGDGQLGLGADTRSIRQPTLLDDFPQLGGDPAVIGVAAGSRHTVLLFNDGNVCSFGFGKFGQLATGKHENASVPQTVPLSSSKATGISAGWWHTLIVQSE